MNENMIFAILGIEQTKDEELIRSAYRMKLVENNPEDNPEGFKALREAYEEALDYAHNSGADDAQQTDDEADNTPVGQWMQRVKNVYGHFSLRHNADCWRELLDDIVCIDLETMDEAKKRLFRFLMDNYQLKCDIYRILDKFYDIEGQQEEFKEFLPVPFVDFMIRQIHDTEGVNEFSYEWFQGADDAPYDEFQEYLYTLEEILGDFNPERREEARNIIEAMSRLDIWHPYYTLAKLRFHYLMEQTQQEEAETDAAEVICTQEDLGVIRELIDQYPSSAKIQLYSAEVLFKAGLKQEAASVFKRVEEELGTYSFGEHYLALYESEQGNYKEAAKYCNLVLNNSDDAEIEQLLFKIDTHNIDTCYEKIGHAKEQNEQSVVQQEGAQETVSENLLTQEETKELLTSLFRTKRYAEGIAFFRDYPEYTDRLDKKHQYLCVLCYSDKQYGQCMEESRLWREHIAKDYTDLKEMSDKDKADYALSLVYEGKCYEIEDDIKAAGLYEEALTYQPEDLNILTDCMDAYIGIGKYEQAIEKADYILSIDSQWFPAVADKQRACYELRRYQEVIDLFYQAKAIYAKYAYMYVLAARTFMIYDQYGDAKEIIDIADSEGLGDNLVIKALKVRFDRMQYLYADNAYGEEKWKNKYTTFLRLKVEKELDEILKKTGADKIVAKRGGSGKEDIKSGNNPDYSVLTYEERTAATMLCYEIALLIVDEKDNPGVSDYEKAIGYVNRAIALKDEGDYHFTLAHYYECMSKHQEAIKEYREYIKKTRFPGGAVYGHLGYCYYWVNDPDQSIQCYEKCLSMNPDDAYAHYKVAFMYETIGQSHTQRNTADMYRKAIEHMQRFLELRDDLEGTVRSDQYINLGDWHNKINQWDKAIEDAECAAKEFGEWRWRMYYIKAKALFYMGKYEEAIKIYRQAADEAENNYNEQLVCEWAACYIKMGLLDKAESMYKEAIGHLKGRDRSRCRLKLTKLYTMYPDRMQEALEQYRLAYEEGDGEVSEEKYCFYKLKTERALCQNTSDVTNLRDRTISAMSRFPSIDMMELLFKIEFFDMGDRTLADKTAEKLVKMIDEKGEWAYYVPFMIRQMVYYWCEHQTEQLKEWTERYMQNVMDEYRQYVRRQKYAKASEMVFPVLDSELPEVEADEAEAVKHYIADVDYGYSNMVEMITYYVVTGQLEKAKEMIDAVHKAPMCKNCLNVECCDSYEPIGLYYEAVGDYDKAYAIYERGVAEATYKDVGIYRLNALSQRKKTDLEKKS